MSHNIRIRLLPATAAALALVAAACGSDDGNDDDGNGGNDEANVDSSETVTLTVNLFGDFGFEPLYEKYMADHPNIKIEERHAEFEEHHTNLVTHLAAGSGAADIEAVEVGFISRFTATPEHFYDLSEFSGVDADTWLDWKWQQGLGPNGEILGLGTDVGGLAMCYRRDLFEAAGLPTDREEVSALWPTWDDYIATGQQFVSVSDTAFVDSPGELMRAMIAQAPVGVYDEDDNVVVESNPDVKAAFDKSVEIIDSGLSAAIAAWTPEWNTGFAQGSFATIICPAWMTSYIMDQAADQQGNWDIAEVPGGSGNSGGSHLMVPAQSDHAEAAYELIKFLTAPEQQFEVFKSNGTFPSTPELYDTPEMQEFASEFFNNAPIGKIFSDAAGGLEPQHLGPLEGDVRAAIGDGLGRIEEGTQSPEDSWAQVLDDVARLS
jgi:cellobiose transport system substrate-binding protein